MAIDVDRIQKPVRKLRKLVKKISPDPTPEKVHDFRTSSRRIEATINAFSLDSKGAGRRILKPLSRVRKRAGKVRDMDVLTEFAAATRPKSEVECHVRLLEHLGARRQKEVGRLHAEVKQLRSGLRKELDQAASRITKLLRANSPSSADNVVTNATATAVRLAAQLSAPPRLNKTNLHPYRLKVKELQNILLMAEASSRPRFVEDLGQVKDAIGEWHDREELVRIASKLLDHGGRCLLLAELKRIAGSKYDHALALALKLRKTYLQSSRPERKGAAIASVPRQPVWEAMARLAG